MKALLAGIIAICAALIILGVVLATRDSSGGPRLIPEDPAYAARVKNGGWTEGDANAPVKLIEYGDFQCPACYAMYPVINDALAQVGSKVLFTFREYPLVQLHDKAEVAALAAEAAGKQGKFWQMHDLLYSSQQSWENDTPGTFRTTTLPSFAAQLQLNVDQFKRDLNDSSLSAPLDTDKAAADAIPLQGTPTLVLNGKTLDPLPTDKDALVTLINNAAAGQSSPTP